MREAVVYALYVWVAVSIAALVVQQVRRFRHRRTTARRASVTVEVATPESPFGLLEQANEAAAVDALGIGATETSVAPPSAGSEPDTLKVPPPVDVGSPAPARLAPPDVALGTPRPASETPMAANHAPQAGTKGLAPLLAGIRLPNDLLPVIPAGVEASDDHVSLITSTAPADVVGPAVADELERLGYQLEPGLETTLVARRGDDVIRLTMIVSPTTATVDGKQVYPAAADGDVVVTFDAGPAAEG